MKKLFLVFVMLFSFSGIVSALNIPSNYTLRPSNNNDINAYKHNSKNFYVINAEYGKFELSLGSVGVQTGVNQWNNKTFEKKSLVSHWFDHGEPYASLNGQFFGGDGALAFPLKGDGNIFQNIDTEPQYTKRGLYMYKGLLPIFYNGYSTSLFNDINVTDAIISLNPYDALTLNEKFKKHDKIGRHYIACMPKRVYNNDLATCDNLLFFYSTYATHFEMLNEIYSWGINPNHIMVMDGSGSSQLYSRDAFLEKYGVTSASFADRRDLPSVISIFSK